MEKKSDKVTMVFNQIQNDVYICTVAYLEFYNAGEGQRSGGLGPPEGERFLQICI
jgi:hypothetical protein